MKVREIVEFILCDSVVIIPRSGKYLEFVCYDDNKYYMESDRDRKELLEGFGDNEIKWIDAVGNDLFIKVEE